MELFLFLVFFASCLMLLISLFIFPSSLSYRKLVKESYLIIPSNTSLSYIASEIAYVFPEFTPLPISEKKFIYKKRTIRISVCPTCGKYLTKRNGKYGTFMGCTGYPNCHYTRPVK